MSRKPYCAGPIQKLRCLRANAALGDGTMNQPATQGRRHHGASGVPSGTLTEDGNVARITAKVRDVSLHPLQRSDSVEQALIASASFHRQFRMGKKAQRPEPVVNGNQHDTHVCQFLTGIARTGAGLVRTAVDPEQHWHPG